MVLWVGYFKHRIIAIALSKLVAPQNLLSSVILGEIELRE